MLIAFIVSHMDCRTPGPVFMALSLTGPSVLATERQQAPKIQRIQRSFSTDTFNDIQAIYRDKKRID